MDRLNKDIKDFYQRMTEDAKLDIDDWAQQSISKLVGNMFNIHDLSQLASMFEGFDMSRLFSMFGGISKGTTTVDPYAILGLDGNCSDDEVKERYKEIMVIVHPDKTQGKTSKLASIVNQAYEQICKMRGIK